MRRVVRALYKYEEFCQTLQGYIFRVLQQFATKLCNFKMSFPAVQIELVLLLHIIISTATRKPENCDQYIKEQVSFKDTNCLKNPL